MNCMESVGMEEAHLSHCSTLSMLKRKAKSETAYITLTYRADAWQQVSRRAQVLHLGILFVGELDKRAGQELHLAHCTGARDQQWYRQDWVCALLWVVQLSPAHSVRGCASMLISADKTSIFTCRVLKHHLSPRFSAAGHAEVAILCV